MNKLFFFLLIGIISLSACKLDDDSDDVFTDCAGLFPPNIEKEWKMVTATYQPENSSLFTIDSTQCLGNLCVDFNLTFNMDSSYVFNYILPYELTSELDTLTRTETGNYTLSYCFNSNNGGSEEWNGEITFNPNSGEEYSTLFLLNSSQVLLMQDLEIKDKGVLDLVIIEK